MEDTHEVSQREPIICNNALYLMELCKVGGIQGLVSENTVNGEILDRTELLLRNETVEGRTFQLFSDDCDCLSNVSFAIMYLRNIGVSLKKNRMKI